MTDARRDPEDRRPTAEEMLARTGAGERARGRLRVYLGMAPGVGKTYRMLEEGHRRTKRGTDLVVGFVEAHGRPETEKLLDGLEIVPRRRVEYRGVVVEEMDTDAILARRPEICAVDELAHTNVPGSVRAKRWEEVVVLRDAGIEVLTTMNVQHLESLNDQVQEIAGITVRETVPDWVVKEADEVVLIDVPPRALLNQLRRGVVYSPEKAARAMESFFKEPTLAALRELVVRPSGPLVLGVDDGQHLRDGDHGRRVRRPVSTRRARPPLRDL